MLMELKPRKSSRKSVTIEEAIISPDIARAWLDKNTGNRKVSAGVVSAYARDMKAGRWLIAGDPIRFDTDGRLLDGQHRLLACIDADVPFASLVVYGLDPATKNVIDSGKARRAKDILQFQGYHAVVILNTAARWVIAYHEGFERTNHQRGVVSISEILSIVKKHKQLPASAMLVRGALGPYPGLLAFLHYAAAHILKMPNEADAFVNVFKTGEPSREGCPAHKLREVLIRERNSATQKMRREEHYRATVHTWNLFAAGESYAQFRIPKECEISGLDRNKLWVP